MLSVKSAFSKLLFSTVRVECRLKTGGVSTGTAFFFNFKIDDQRHLPLLVTNKHVVEGAEIAQFHVHEALSSASGESGPSPTSFPVTITEFQSAWFMHPDPSADLCVMPFEPLRQQAQAQGKTIFSCPLDDSLIPNQTTLDGLSALEDIVMVGYPIGLWDSTNNLPILRRGATASHPATDFQGKAQGVVDMACFPGSSGSPILILNEGAFSTPNGLTVGGRIHLLGVLFAGPVYRADGKIEIIDIPTYSVPVPVTTIPIHLGYYVKASALWRLKDVLFEKIRLK
ncbi:MAG: serine protease [Bryobacteraceae bacterium]|nr:trypsin-like peptidase domain-containing protein [Solibacteraceae bacterium]MCO5351710.1 serine protease [Bryobacteraceae bacterium]